MTHVDSVGTSITWWSKCRHCRPSWDLTFFLSTCRRSQYNAFDATAVNKKSFNLLSITQKQTLFLMLYNPFKWLSDDICMTSLATALSQKMATFPREHISTKPFNSLTFKPYNNPTKFIFKKGIRSEGNGTNWSSAFLYLFGFHIHPVIASANSNAVKMNRK